MMPTQVRKKFYIKKIEISETELKINGNILEIAIPEKDYTGLKIIKLNSNAWTEYKKGSIEGWLKTLSVDEKIYFNGEDITEVFQNILTAKCSNKPTTF